MRRIFAAVLGAGLVVAGAAVGQTADAPVVVELYTSQGCSSCPPADELLLKLAARDDVIALALHVDYWDYLGWADVFASPAFTKRQKAYARAVGARSVYTPQMVVQGQDHLVGIRPMELADLIRDHAAMPDTVRVTMTRDGARLRIRADRPARPLKRKLSVQLVRYTPEASVDIRRGENSGRKITYANVVTSWEVLGEWDGAAALDMTARAAGNAPSVVILQDPGPGAILAAARLR